MDQAFTGRNIAQVGRTLNGSVVLACMLLLAAVAYAPVTFMQASLKWDMLDCYLPWRHFVAERFSQGAFPLWNPYQSLGYPIHGDLRSVYYPEGLLVGLLNGGYGIGLLHALFLMHLALAGTGMYLLAGHFTKRTEARLLVGAGYMLSGFFTGHGQEMFAIIAGAWIPFILYHAIHVLQGDGRGGHPPKLAVVLFLQLTGGYQALSIMLLYLLVILTLVLLVERWRKREHAAVKVLMMRMGLWSLLIALSCAVLAVTYVGTAPHIDRFSGMALEVAQINPFPPKALLSLLFPHAAVADNASYGTDISMTNAYVGLLPLSAFLLSFLRRRTALEHVLLWFGTVCLLASFGPHLPVREWLFKHAPLMDLFRMPSYFRYYAMLAILLLGAAELGRWLDRPEVGVRRAQWAVALVGLVCSSIAAAVWYKHRDISIMEHIGGLAHAWGDTPVSTHVLVQAAFILPLLAVCWVTLRWMRSRHARLFALLATFLLVDMIIAVRLNMPATVVQEVPPARIAQVLKAMPAGSMLPDLRQRIGQHRDDDPAYSPLWRNTGIFARQVSAFGFNSFTIDAYQRFEAERGDLFQATLQGPVLFLSHTLCPEQRWRMEGATPGDLVVPDSVHAVWGALPLQPGPKDTIMLERFAAGDVACTVELEHGAVLTLAQMDHPGWSVRVDGITVPHAPGHLALLSVALPPGRHAVEFTYTRPSVLVAYVISYLLFFCFIGSAIHHILLERRGLSPRRAGAWAAGTVFTMVVLLLASWSTRRDDVEQRAEEISSLAAFIRQEAGDGGIAVCMDVDDPTLLKDMLADVDAPMFQMRSAHVPDIARLRSWLASLGDGDVHELILASRGAELPSDVEEILLRAFPGRYRVFERDGARVLHLDRDGKREPVHVMRLEFGEGSEAWRYDAAILAQDTVDGRIPSWPMDPTRPGSPHFETTFQELGSVRIERIVFSLDGLRMSPDADANMYIVIERTDGSEWHVARSIAAYAPEVGAWSPVLMVGQPPFVPDPMDRLKVFVWNEGTGELRLDGIALELFGDPHPDQPNRLRTM